MVGMVGQSETPSDYDEEWESLLDSGILEDLLQKAEHENAVKRATQLTPVENLNLPDCEILEKAIQNAEHESAVKRATQVAHTFSTPQALQTLVPPSTIPVDPSVQPSCILSTSVPAAHVSGRAPQLHTENAFSIRSQAFNGPRKPPLPFELRGSQGYYQDRYEGAHLPTNLSQLPTQTPGSLRYGSAVNNGAVSTPNQPSNGVSGLHRDGGLPHVNEQLAERNGTISVLRSKLQQVNSEEGQDVLYIHARLVSLVSLNH